MSRADRLQSMTVPFWCLFIAALLPTAWFSLASPMRMRQLGKNFDRHTPRSQEPQLVGLAARAHGVHMNSLEALTYFAPAVLVAHLSHADTAWSARLCVAFLGFRLLYGLMYLLDRPSSRTAAFALALLTSFSLFVLAARA